MFLFVLFAGIQVEGRLVQLPVPLAALPLLRDRPLQLHLHDGRHRRRALHRTLPAVSGTAQKLNATRTMMGEIGLYTRAQFTHVGARFRRCKKVVEGRETRAVVTFKAACSYKMCW